MIRRIAVFVLLFAFAQFAFATEKLIAVTFDDGPRPYVLFGKPGLLDVLDKQGVKATFFVMGWRLTPKTWGDRRYEPNIGMSCIDAAREVLKRGHEIEDHTFSHVNLRAAEKKQGEQWVIADVEHGAQVIKSVAGTQPKFVRPPDWLLPDDARHQLELRGFQVLTISIENAMPLRDVNSLDYLCAGTRHPQCPKPSLADAVLRQIEQREKKGVYTHILAFHELTTTTAEMPELIAKLKARGYRFATVAEYMRAVQVTGHR